MFLRCQENYWTCSKLKFSTHFFEVRIEIIYNFSIYKFIPHFCRGKLILWLSFNLITNISCLNNLGSDGKINNFAIINEYKTSQKNWVRHFSWGGFSLFSKWGFTLNINSQYNSKWKRNQLRRTKSSLINFKRNSFAAKKIILIIAKMNEKLLN